jgi:hypothetical protein
LLHVLWQVQAALALSLALVISIFEALYSAAAAAVDRGT